MAKAIDSSFRVLSVMSGSWKQQIITSEGLYTSADFPNEQKKLYLIHAAERQKLLSHFHTFIPAMPTAWNAHPFFI